MKRTAGWRSGAAELTNSRFAVDRREERGATLILALVFIVVVGLVVAAISDLAINNLGNTTRFNSASSLDYAASSVGNLAIQSVRYTPQAQAKTIGECWAGDGPVSQFQFNQFTVAAWCTTVLHPGSSQSRIVTIYECESGLTESTTPGQLNADLAAESACEAKPLLTVVEAYDDYSSSGQDLCNLTPSASTCGFGASTIAWVWGPLATATGGLVLNSISISTTPPSPAHVGGQYSPIATATSGDQVTITSATTSVCTVASGVVSFIHTGSCTVDFNDSGNFIYAPATELTQIFSIT